jgi:hypothetical protein
VVVGLDENRTQHAGLAFDVNSSLIYIEAVTGSTHVLALAAGRIRQQIRSQDSILLTGSVCALLLPMMSFAGAQLMAGQLSPLMTDVLCEIQVYHGATALLLLQRLHEAGAEKVEGFCKHPHARPGDAQAAQIKKWEMPTDGLPYLAFLTNYPSTRLLHLFPYELACLYQCIPVGAVRNMLTLATCHWLNREIVTQLRVATHRGIFQVRCEVTLINEVLRYWQHMNETVHPACSTLEMDDAWSSSR